MEKSVRIGLAILATAYTINFGYHALKATPHFYNELKAMKNALHLAIPRNHLRNKRIKTEEEKQKLDSLENQLKPYYEEQDYHLNLFVEEMKKGLFPGYSLLK